MRTKDLNQFGITPREEQFVQLVARGATRREAAIKANPQRKGGVNAHDQWAKRAIQNPAVADRLRSLLYGKKIHERDSEGLWHADLQRLIEAAETSGNHTAIASYMRMRGQALGVLKDRVIISTEQTMTDDDLVKQLAGDDERKAATLRSVLGSGTFAKAA